ncbi:hypothetical protein L3C95_31990 [Chitinophaga filiformis]|uniref:hypothetical protein n=1 Tax=Chitinophaga filiformis TaxID=104663 RepID=UPI001F3D930D|nr:hypothetical protein [Chitinophaga filiformis]MCF6407555.1 hypothetical protein [Chitinophaga filiformis]
MYNARKKEIYTRHQQEIPSGDVAALCGTDDDNAIYEDHVFLKYSEYYAQSTG